MRWTPFRVLAAYGLGAVLVAVPVDALGAGSGAGLSSRSLVAAVAGADPAPGDGYVLDRRGEVLRVGVDGSVEPTARLGRYSTPFGTSVAGRAVFGGVRCDGGGRSGCDRRVAELAVLDDNGHIATKLTVTKADGWPTLLNGLALVGPQPTTPTATAGLTGEPGAAAAGAGADVGADSPGRAVGPGGSDGAGLAGGARSAGATGRGAAGGGVAVGGGDTMWVNGGARLHEVVVDRGTGEARVVGVVPWRGGEPCVVGGVLHDLAATRGIAGRQGSWLGEGTTPPFLMVLRRWDGERWQRVAGGTRTMANGRNAYCTADGYEIRDGTTTVERWTPSGGWDEAAAPSLVRMPPVDDGAGFPRATVADGDGTFGCATTYLEGDSETRCGPFWRRAERYDVLPAARTEVPHTPQAVDHYNMCSSACGPGMRSHTRDVVAWLVGRNRPAALSLNEACYDDAVHLAGRLATTVTAVAGYSALDTAVGCPGAVKRFGNLVMIGAGLAPGVAWWGAFTSQAEQPCDHRANECRGMVCVDAAPAGARRGSRAFCSAHLESPRRAGAAEAQAAEYVATVDARFGAHRARVLAGDFNLGRSPTDDVLGPAGYRAAKVGATVGPPGSGDEIDRIYDDSSGGDPGGSLTRYCDRQASDHCYLTSAPRSPPPSSPVV